MKEQESFNSCRFMYFCTECMYFPILNNLLGNLSIDFCVYEMQLNEPWLPQSCHQNDHAVHWVTRNAMKVMLPDWKQLVVCDFRSSKVRMKTVNRYTRQGWVGQPIHWRLPVYLHMCIGWEIDLPAEDAMLIPRDTCYLYSYHKPVWFL